MPRYAARRTLPAPVEEVWAVLAEPERLAGWWPGVERAQSTVRTALAAGARWQVEGSHRPSFRRRPQAGGSLIVLEVVPLRRIAFQLTGVGVEAELALEPDADECTEATLTVEAPHLAGVGRSFPSQALAKLAALVRRSATDADRRECYPGIP